MRNSFITATLFAAIGSAASLGTMAAGLYNGDVLTITSGNAIKDGTGYRIGFSGSYYGVDINGDNQISQDEKIVLAQGTTGLVIGALSTPGAFHSGLPTPSDSNAVTAPDAFFGNTGSWYFDIAPTGSTESGLNMSGWDWAWNGLYSWGLGGLGWQPTNCADLGCSGYTFQNGVGRLQWDGVYGHAYTLDTTSTVPPGDPSGCGGCQFYTHLEGTVTPVPEPAPIWMFSAALLMMLGIAKKRKA
jgi:hypothetical protein